MTLSFAADIRPLFRGAPDIEAMKRYGLDLSSYVQGQREGAGDLRDPNSQHSAFAHNPKMQLILRMNVPRFRPTVANDVGDTGA